MADPLQHIQSGNTGNQIRGVFACWLMVKKEAPDQIWGLSRCDFLELVNYRFTKRCVSFLWLFSNIIV
jgi:hypothetical protein